MHHFTKYKIVNNQHFSQTFSAIWQKSKFQVNLHWEASHYTKSINTHPYSQPSQAQAIFCANTNTTPVCLRFHDFSQPRAIK
jgi:hypothetical protein